MGAAPAVPPARTGEPGPTGTERVVMGDLSVSDIYDEFTRYVEGRLGSPISEVRFRAGRIDVVWGVALRDGREVVVKCHRLPVDIASVTATRDALRTLRAARFPCPAPLSGPDELDGRVLTLDSLTGEGRTPGRGPAHRQLLARGLAEHIDLLRSMPELRDRIGPGPSWCHYQSGPWPVPHDPIVDFSATPDGYAWLDAVATAAADQILTHRAGEEIVVGHADWYAGNVAVAGGSLVATFDWELVADTEAVIAGFTAACFGANPTNPGGLSTPEEVAAFLRDYDRVRPAPLTARERLTAAGAATWIAAFNVRWDLGLQHPDQPEGPTLSLLRARRDDYLALAR